MSSVTSTERSSRQFFVLEVGQTSVPNCSPKLRAVWTTFEYTASRERASAAPFEAA